MRWAAAALLLLAAPAAGQEEAQAARRLVFDASRALQAGNAARFLGCFDKRATPDFERLRDSVVTLLAAKNVASSIEVIEAEAGAGETRLRVDWLLQLTPIRELGAVQQRRETVEVRVRAGRKPKIVFLEPIELFRPVLD